MDHAEVLGRIYGAIVAPGGLTTLVADPSPDAVAIREHVRGCLDCAAEWRAWSEVSAGLAAAAPEAMGMRPDARDRILGAVTTRPRTGAALGATAMGAASVTGPGRVSPPTSGSSVVAPPTDRLPAPPSDRIRLPAPPSDLTRLPAPQAADRTVRTAGLSTTARRGPRREDGHDREGSWFRWIALAAAAAVVFFVAGAAFGRPLGLGGGEPVQTSQAPRILAVTAGILERQGYGLAQLHTPDGGPGGFVAVSPGSGQLTVVTRALTAPPAGTRYICLVDRDGVTTPVGYMQFDGDLAFWAGPVDDPVDLGLSGDEFLVQLETPGSPPVLSGTF